ncbi:MAG TPA: hypothetical protein VKA46_08485 [Gemmataceae bacterium]|nr:hypothetical protein [Gemmataceae bacterium]
MILFYALLLLLLVVARYVIVRRVAALERKYVKIARTTDELLKAQPLKPGNTSKPDPYAAARQAYLLGQAVERRERLEARYCACQKLGERFTALVAAVRGWKGRKLPYVVGALDVLLVFGALDYFGYRDHLSAQAVVEFLSSLVSKNA